ncbi:MULTISPECIES: FMN-binding negative transcriptional regulator [unclassified Shewanella]|uniref:FMN-binding negative transcriptional regulator n=1 Tax=unclassified Shewanella TaxID=196818 RepID=UPI000C858039|nr:MULTISPECIES: FMN-binding negative transcriptional regulator [unclassified Shewanella]MDO6777012.1 FMN-binding negative transcriptional regulator [Shewanella sp. 3_MG-2023]PMI02277.1 hypothetical protein BCU55_07300 [Shewanella sp. 10N.286.48.A6]
MYLPKKLQMQSNEALDFIQQYGFALLSSSDLQASHLPLILKTDADGNHTLYGHMAKANNHWKTLDLQSVLAVFSGPHGYISPTWYDGFPAVPTWNYAAVHVTGTFELTDNNETILHLTDTIAKYEPELLQHGGFIPHDYRDKLAKAIVGFKISITGVEGKLKLGQHRSEADQLGVLAGLAKSTNLDAQQLYQYTKQMLSQT